MEMEKLVSLSKRRGFLFQSSEIYGGTGSCWDYGPLGIELISYFDRLWNNDGPPGTSFTAAFGTY
jgi:glycyl-tRNA synthetase